MMNFFNLEGGTNLTGEAIKNTQDPQTGLNGFFVRNVDENKAESSPSRAKERIFINRSESECHLTDRRPAKNGKRWERDKEMCFEME